MPFAWDYDGATNLDIDATGLTPSGWYRIRGRDADSSPFQIQADGAGAFSTSLTGIGDPGGVDGDPGSVVHLFAVEIYEVDDAFASNVLAMAGANIFTFGVASTTGTPSGAVWTFDGTTGFAVDYLSNAALEYRLAVFYPVTGTWNSENNAGWQTGTGGTDNRSLTLGAASDATPAYVALEAREPGSSDPSYVFQVSNRLFTGGSTVLSGGDSAESPPPDTNTSGGVRVGVAFDDVTLEPDPDWTYLTDTENVVAGYEISRGGESEFEHTNPSSASVKLNDQNGLLDPTNSSGPYYGLIEPLLQIIIQLWNPVTEEWQTRFRGFIEDYDYTVEPFAHQNLLGDTVGVTRLTISCVDLEAILVPIEMQPDGAFGDTVPAQSVGNIFFDNASAHDRITQVFANAGIPTDFYIVFTLNVDMPESVYSPGSNVMEVIQDAVDAEFPTVANRYIDRLGRMAIHGRLAKFDPDGTASDAGPTAWDFTRWKCGDEKAVALSPTDTAHIRTFAFNRGMSKVYNSALCTPNGIDGADIGGQFSSDGPSVAQYGVRSWSAENLLIESGTLTGNTALQETALFAAFITANYAQPRNRITDVTFRSMSPAQEGAAANWDLLCRIDISDVVEVTVSLPGGGGLSLEPFFVEGITESCEPLNGEYANVTLAPSLSPLAYFTDPSGLDGV